MSQATKWWDDNVSHSTERREARDRTNKQISEFEKLKADTKAKADQLQKEKTYEENRLSRNKMRRMRGGSKKTGFLHEAVEDSGQMRETLG